MPLVASTTAYIHAFWFYSNKKMGGQTRHNNTVERVAYTVWARSLPLGPFIYLLRRTRVLTPMGPAMHEKVLTSI